MEEHFDYMGRIQELGEMVYPVVAKSENKALFEFLRDTILNTGSYQCKIRIGRKRL